MQYMGSKNRLSKEIVPIIQNYITKETKGYIEPFVGGANVIDKIKCDTKIGCDIHEYLIELLKHISETVKDVPDFITEEEYHIVKNNKQDYEKWYVGLVGFTATFANKFFGGAARNKTKTTKDYSETAIKNIKKQAPLLKNIRFKKMSFLEIPKEKISDYVIYCDPPYRGTTKYATDNFPYDEFYEWCREMSKNNIVLVSEYNMPDDFECIWEKETSTQIDSKRKKEDVKTKRTEKLFVYKG